VVPKVLHNLPGILLLHHRLAVLRVLRIRLVRNLRQSRRLLAVVTHRRPVVCICPRLKALVRSLRVNRRHLSLPVPNRRFTFPCLKARVLKATRIHWHLKALAPSRQFSLPSRQIVHIRRHRTQRVQNLPFTLSCLKVRVPNHLAIPLVLKAARIHWHLKALAPSRQFSLRFQGHHFTQVLQAAATLLPHHSLRLPTHLLPTVCLLLFIHLRNLNLRVSIRRWRPIRLRNPNLQGPNRPFILRTRPAVDILLQPHLLRLIYHRSLFRHIVADTHLCLGHLRR
jgi:hypothetical protein